MKSILFSAMGEMLNSSYDILLKNKIKTSAVITTREKAVNLPEADVLISMCYPYRISKAILQKYNYCINFHPAPLPDYKGFSVYNFGIYNEEKTWGATAHHMDENFDTGDIIKVERFEIKDPSSETVSSLRYKSRQVTLVLLEEVLRDLKKGKDLPRLKNEGGTNYTREMFEGLRKTKPSMSSEEVLKRVRACHFPPYKGAFMELGDKRFYLSADD